MKRNLDLFRLILLSIEASTDSTPIDSRRLDLPETSVEEVFRQCELMLDAGLIVAQDMTSSTTKNSMAIHRMSNDGHDYLDAVRSQKVWDGVKSGLAQQGLSATVDIAKALAVAIITKSIGLS